VKKNPLISVAVIYEKEFFPFNFLELVRGTYMFFFVYHVQLKHFVEQKAEKPIHIVITCDVPTYGN